MNKSAATARTGGDGDLASLICLLQSYEDYGNRGAPPDCLVALTDKGRRQP